MSHSSLLRCMPESEHARSPDPLRLKSAGQAGRHRRPAGRRTSSRGPTPSSRPRRTGWPARWRQLGVGIGDKVIWCGPNSPQVVAVMAATRKIGAVAVPLNYRLTAEEAQYIIVHSDAGRRVRRCRVRASVRSPGGGQLGSLRARPRLRRRRRRPACSARTSSPAAPAEPPGEEAEAAGATMIYTSGTTGKPKGALPEHGRPGDRDGADRPHRLHARRRLPHLRPAVPQRPERLHGRRAGPRPDHHRAAQVRPGGLAAAGRHLQGQLDLLGAAADPDRVRAARRGQGPLRPLEHEADAGQRGAVELRAQAGVPGRLSR